MSELAHKKYHLSNKTTAPRTFTLPQFGGVLNPKKVNPQTLATNRAALKTRQEQRARAVYLTRQGERVATLGKPEKFNWRRGTKLS